MNILVDKECNTLIQDNDFEEGFVYVYILQYNRETCGQVFIKEASDDNIKFDFKQDGFYTLCTLKITTNPLAKYYYKDGKFYTNIQEVDLLDLLEINPLLSGVTIKYEYYFQTCRLRQCYARLCQKILNSKNNRCSFGGVDKDLLYKRDLISISLAVLEYLVDLDKYEEADALLQEITECNGLCEDVSRCGCHG